MLTAELTAINQYFIHAKMMSNWGYERLASRTRAESIDEMHHAEQVIERILFLDGSPEPAAPVAGAGRRGRARAVPCRRRARVRRHQAPERRHRRLRGGRRQRHAATCSSASSSSEEEHADWLETQLGLLASLGETAYLAEQLATDASLRDRGACAPRAATSGQLHVGAEEKRRDETMS